MADRKKVYSLDSLRTDGWFERIGEGIGSFQALCEIVGERFFAFSIIVGARITALTIDRRSPDQTLVDGNVMEFVDWAETERDATLSQVSTATRQELRDVFLAYARREGIRDEPVREARAEALLRIFE